MPMGENEIGMELPPLGPMMPMMPPGIDEATNDTGPMMGMMLPPNSAAPEI